MKAFKACSILILLLPVLFSCKAGAEREKPLIVVSIYPYELLVKELVGSAADVISIIPPAASPHDWSPNPSNLSALSKAKLIIINGLDLEQSLNQALRQHQDKLLVISELIRFKPDSLYADDPEHSGAPDPHIWTSVNYLQRMVDALEPELRSRFSELADSISASSLRVRSGLKEVDSQIRAEVSSFKDPAIITYHNSFGYFLKDYGILHLASVQSAPGKEPGPRELGELGRLIKARGLKAIFVEPQMSRKSAEVLAREFGLRILILDPIGNSLGAETIYDFLLSNWKIMRLGLQEDSPSPK